MTTHEMSALVRWLVIIALGVATAGMVAVSLRANYLFGYGFGQTPEKAQVFGWANVAADIWKVTGLVLVTSLWRARRKRFALLLTPIWLLCLLWGIAGAIGVYAQDRSSVVGGREAKGADYRDVGASLKDLDAKLKKLGNERTVKQVDAAIAAVLARPVMRGERVRGTVGSLSNNCTKADRATADACEEVARLRETRATAEEAERLETRQTELAAQLTKLREAGGSLPADPVAELLAWLSRGQLNVRDIAFGFPLVFALLIEIVSAFGPAGLVAFAEATRPTMPAHSTVTEPAMTRLGELEPAPARLGAQGRVVTWMAERTEPTSATSAIGVETLHADYEVWCLGKNLSAAALNDFQDEFDALRDVPELAGKIRKFAHRYYGIRLVDRKVAKLPVRKQDNA